MSSAGDIVKNFYVAAANKDLVAARRYLDDELVFVGLFETYPTADAYMAAFSSLLQITVALNVKVIIAQENEVAVFFQLQTTAPAEATVLVAEWHRIRNGKIWHVESAFDGRPYAAMFSSN